MRARLISGALLHPNSTATNTWEQNKRKERDEKPSLQKRESKKHGCSMFILVSLKSKDPTVEIEFQPRQG